MSGEVARLGTAGFRSDAAIKGKAREILQPPTTAADDNVLVEKCSSMMREKLGLISVDSSPGSRFRDFFSSVAPDAMDISALPLDMDMGITDSEINDILQDMDFDFGDTLDSGIAGRR